jgi:hypothetical protein
MLRWFPHHADVDAPMHDRIDLFDRRHLVELHVHCRERSGEGGGRGHDQIAVAGRRPDGEGMVGATGHAPHLLVRRLDADIGLAGLLEEHDPEIGQAHRARAAVEQRAAELPLETTYRFAHRRLGEMEPTSGATEVQFIGHGDETLDFAQVHAASTVKRNARRTLQSGPGGGNLANACSRR